MPKFYIWVDVNVSLAVLWHGRCFMHALQLHQVAVAYGIKPQEVAFIL